MKTAKITAALFACLALSAVFSAGSASALIGFRGLSNEFAIPNTAAPLIPNTGTPVTQAASHPDLKNTIQFNIKPIGGEFYSDDTIRDVIVDQPAGFYGNAQSLPFCEMETLLANEGFCNPDAQVGVFYFGYGLLGLETQAYEFPIYNMKSSDNQTATLAVVSFSVPIKFLVSVRTDGDYGLQVRVPNINSGLGVTQLPVELWGVPEAESHDAKRCITYFVCGYSSSIPPTPFLTLPSRCEPVTTSVRIRSWEHPDYWVSKDIVNGPLTGCDGLDFSPTLKARPTTNAADSPTGLESDLHIPQSTDPEGLSTAQMRTTEVTLPEGMVINPSSANGLSSCSPSQVHLTSPIGVNPPVFSKAEPECPSAAKIGSVRVDTPLLADPMLGSVYVAEPYDNPFDSLLAIYAVFKGPGLNIKIAGEIKPDPKTGRLTAIFAENPQLSFEDFKLNFFGGAFAALRTPATCGTYSTTSTITAWSSPESGPPVHPSDEYAISQAPGGKKACPTTQGARPNAPTFEGGSMAALAGQYKPFVVNLRRDDGSQEFSDVTLTPPPGLVAKLANTAICSDGALSAAAGKSGRQEQATPSCPAPSEVGTAGASAGAGPAPYNTSGKVYLAGPYKGAPLSLAIVVPAVAGPYDLGNVVTRTALYLDPVTAKITAKADPIPQILKGIPLDVRSVSVRLDKPDFTLNPTSCDPMEVSGSLVSTLGNSAALNSRFQLAECGRLKFKPSLRLSLKGGTKRGEYPALTAVLKNRSGDANISSVQVALPHSEFLAQEHIRTVCTRVQWAADACPKGSIYGKVKVNTPLLGYALTGNVYLRSSSNPLPDLVPDLRGPAFQPIRFEAAGKTDSINAGIRNTFGFVPDVPFSKLTLQLQGGKKGLLVNSRNICKSVNKADVSYGAHNGLAYSEQPALSVKCKKAKKGKGSSKKGKRGGKH